jgi:hypothetical protein
LQRLTVKIPLDNSPVVVENLEALLHSQSLPSLKHLAILDQRDNPVVGAMSLLLPVLLDSKLLSRLETLELRGYLTNRNITTLWDRREELARLTLRIDPRREPGKTASGLLADLGQKVD